MKYTFELNKSGNTYKLKVDVSEGNTITANVQKYLDIDENNYKIEVNELLNDMIDNMRLTVNERKEARENLDIFLKYVINETKTINKEQLIVEQNII